MTMIAARFTGEIRQIKEIKGISGSDISPIIITAITKISGPNIMRQLNEDAVEYDACQLLLRELGYAEILWGPDIAPEGTKPQERELHEVVLRDRLAAAVQKINPHLPATAREDVLKKTIRTDSPELLLNNQAFHRLLTEGVDVTFRNANNEIRTEKAWLLDFAQPERNEFVAVRQLTVIENQKNRRADTVIYVNGLPLVLLEFKNPNDVNATLENAFKQIQTYQKEISSLFRYNAFSIIGDGIFARAGTISSDFGRFSPWKSTDGQNLVEAGRPDQETLLRGMLNKKTLVDLLRHFILFEEMRDRTIKKLAQYHQYFAVNKSIRSAIRASSPIGGGREGVGDRRGGVVWHTQGSGKSLSMVFFAGKLVVAPEMENPTIVVLTDRNDLDQQLFGTFSDCRGLLRQTPKQAENRDSLKDLLGVASGGIVFTTIQKFLVLEDGGFDKNGKRKMVAGKYPELSARRNIVVLADEAHRSQYDMIDGFAAHIRSALPNATFMGFTGTPIEKADASTRAIFGNYNDVYDIKRAVDDGATVPIYYESRLAKIKLDEEAAKVLDEKINEFLDDFSENDELAERQQRKAKWARIEAVVGSKSRLEEVAKDIVQHFERRNSASISKAMVVCMSRRICVDLHDEVKKLRPDWYSNDDLQGEMKVIMTGVASDGPEWQEHIRNKQRTEAIGNRLKNPEDKLKLVFVRDMWLTGFDAPCLNTLYVDKPMCGHNLMQAIARTNRVFREKTGGLIVDYIGIAYDLKVALENYVDNGGQGKPTYDEKEAVLAFQLQYEKVLTLFAKTGSRPGFNYKFYFRLDKASDRVEFIADTMDFLAAQPNGVKQFKELVFGLLKAFALAAADDEVIKYRDEVQFFQEVRNQLVKKLEVEITDRGQSTKENDGATVDTVIRQLVSAAVISGSVVDLFAIAGIPKPDISGILSPEFMHDVKNLKRKNLAAEMLRKILGDELRFISKTNIVQSRLFSEMLENAVRKYQNQMITTVEFIEGMISMAKDMNKAKNRGEELGLTEGEVAFYDALETNDSAVAILGDAVLKQIALDLYKSFRENASIDWSSKESVRAKLRSSIKRVLKVHGYPPDKQEQVVKLVLEQAELMAGEIVV
jgi:type I restriction enzyme R subunit